MAVSVVIPDLDGPLVHRTLEALAAQGAPGRGIEVLVVGRDAHGLVPRGGDGVSAVRFVETAERLNPAAARNRGVAEARGERILFTDADCRPLPGWAERLAAALDASPVAGGAVTFRLDGNPWALADNIASFHELLADRPAERDTRGPLGSLNLALTRDAWRRVGPFDEALTTSEDFDWVLRAREGGLATAFVPEAMVEHADVRDDRAAVERHATWYGSHFHAFRRRHTQAFGTGPTWRWRWLLRLTAPLKARLAARAILRAHPQLAAVRRRARPGVVAFKRAWYRAVVAGWPRDAGADPERRRTRRTMSAEATTESRFLSSALAAYGSQGGRTLLRLATDLVLARLILAEDHGLFELAIAAVMIAGVVRDLGLPYQLVRDEREPYGTVAAWTAGAGLLLAGLLALGSPLFGGLDPRLPMVVAGLAPLLFLEGLSIAPRVFFERRLEVRRLVVPELVRAAVLATVAIVLATLGAGVWSFVAGELAGMAVFSVLLWIRAWRRMPRRVEPGILGDLLHRSRYLFVIAMCAFALPYIERYVLAPFVTTAIVAQFGKARYFGGKVQVLLVPAVQRVLYPALVELRLHPRRAFGAFRVGTVSILAFEALAAWFFFFNARTVILDVLFGPQWVAAVPLLRIVAFVPLVNPMSRLGGELLKVRGEDRLWLVIVVLDLVSLLGFGIFLTSHWGATGMAWAEFLLLGNLLMTWRIAHVLGRDFWRLAGDLAFVYLVPAVPFLPVLWLFPEEGWGRFAASVAAAAVGALLLLARFQRPFRAWFAAAKTAGAAEAAEDA